MKLVLCVLVLAVTLSMAGNLTASVDGTSGTNRPGLDAETIVWSQLPTGGAMASQKFTDYDSTEVDCGVADDFQFPTETTINKIRVWGNYWNGAGPFPVDCYFQIYLYNDDGTGNAPTLPEHSTAIQYWAVAPGEYTEVLDVDNYLIEYELPEWVVFAANTKYWFEFRKVFSFGEFGQWGWVQSEPIFLSPCVQGTIGFGSGAPVWWTPQAYDASFELIWDDELTLEASTWADIKTIF